MGEPHRSEETKRKISETMIGITRSFETRRKMSQAQMGNQYWLDKHHTEASKKKMSDNFTGEGNPMFGITFDKNPQWKGDNASYSAIHLHLRKHFPPPNACPECGFIGQLDLACVNGIYNRDIRNYKYLCRLCHMKLDSPKHRKDMSKRICEVCGSNKTYVKNNGWVVWTVADNKMMCGRCYNRHQRAKRRL